jgi:hypothetical protein
MLDWTSRIEQGQIPHNDFQSLVGPGFLYTCWFFLKLAHFDLFGFSLANIAVASVAFGSALSLIAIAYKYCSARPPLLPTALILLVLLSCTYGTYILAFDGVISYANIYNRWGYALLAVVFLQSIIIRETPIGSAAITGCILGALFLIKSTYAYAGLGLVIIGIILGYERRPTHIALILVATLATVAVFLIATDISPSSLLHDYAVPMKNRSVFLMHYTDVMTDKLLGSTYALLLIGSMGVLLIQHARKGTPKEILCFLAFLAMTFLLQLTNFGFMDSPMSIMVLIFSLQSLNLIQKSPILAFALIALVGGCFCAKNFGSFAEAGLLAFNKNHYPEFQLGSYTGLRVIDIHQASDRDFDNNLQDGINLVRTNIKNPEKIAALSYENPFNIAFNTTAPRHLPTIWDYGMSYSKKSFPAFDDVFSDTNLIIIEKQPDSNGAVLSTIYKDDLDHEFRLVTASSLWTLMQRKER